MAVQIEVGRTYRQGSYKSPDRVKVTVTAILPDEQGWYDDHQEGGWWSKGCVEFTVHGKYGGEGFVTSLEYAQDHWEAESPCTC